MDSLLKTVALSRLMLPDDANSSGNVHGGTILKMLEDAGGIITTRYCNAQARKSGAPFEECVTALVRLEHTDFVKPMHIGEISELVAEITYTSPHSLQVIVTVWAENLLSGSKRMTNNAHLWYVALSAQVPDKVMSVPSMDYPSAEAEERGHQEYERQKQLRRENDESANMITDKTLFSSQSGEAHTVAFSRSNLIHLVNVNDVNFSGRCRGGVLLKIMDECGGIASFRHSQRSVVTACVQATNFHFPVPKGALVSVFAHLTFTSAKSMETEVVVEIETLVNGSYIRRRCVDAFFTYVAMKEGKPQPVPMLQVQTDEERQRFEAGKQRYERKKRERLSAQAKTNSADQLK